MASGVTITIDEGQYQRALSLMNPKQLKQAMRSAVTKATREGRVAIRKQVQEVLNVKTGAINDVITSKVSTVDGQPVGMIRVSKRPLAIIDFKGVRATKRNGVTVTTIKAKPPVHLRHAFKRAMKSGHVGIFERAKGRTSGRYVRGRGGKQRFVKGGLTPKGIAWGLQIDEAYGPTVYGVTNVPHMLAQAAKTIADALFKNFESQFSRFDLKLKPAA